eukprot:16621_1
MHWSYIPRHKAKEIVKGMHLQRHQNIEHKVGEQELKHQTKKKKVVNDTHQTKARNKDISFGVCFVLFCVLVYSAFCFWLQYVFVCLRIIYSGFIADEFTSSLFW